MAAETMVFPLVGQQDYNCHKKVAIIYESEKVLCSLEMRNIRVLKIRYPKWDK
jgi:hypothetical protein